ncbi:MAG: 50S ribosomal protein L11 methyltransferase [Lachnospiraceae bacterium]|nr:50S ribosomal protein L11 methyltransferase [Lachnospiraceae bacterium]
MKWMRFQIRTRVEAEDILVSGMQDIGLHGAQIEDHVPLTAAEKEQMFVDILPDVQPDDGSAVLSFFVEETESGTLMLDDEEKTPDEVRAAIEEQIEEMRQYCDFIGDGTVTVYETEDIDWINNWKQYFHQFMIDDILVTPSWEKIIVPDENDGPTAELGDPAKKPFSLVFHIDPGTAFGTGMHETTQLCIREIRKYLQPDTKILDIGTGSGILGILSLMLGADSVVGTDLDPCTVEAVRENLEANGVDPERFTLHIGNLIDDKALQDEVGYEKYDIVVANILAGVLVQLTPSAVAALKPGGVFITSGIIDGYEDSVKEAMVSAGLTVEEVTDQGEWHCVTGRKA